MHGVGNMLNEGGNIFGATPNSLMSFDTLLLFPGIKSGLLTWYYIVEPLVSTGLMLITYLESKIFN